MKCLCIFLLLFNFLVIQSQQALYKKEFAKNYINKKYSRVQVKQDIDFMVSKMKEIHPNFYHNFTEPELKTTIDSILATINDSVDIYQVSFSLSVIQAKFNEGHLGLLTNKETYNSFKLYDKKFPYSLLRITDSTLIIKSDESNEHYLAVADSIFSINGVHVSKLVKKFKCYFGGIEKWKEFVIKSQFDYLLFASKIYSPFIIEAWHNGKKEMYTVNGVAKQNNLVRNQRNNPNYSYSIINNETAYINFYSMIGNFDSFKDSIKTTFKDINDKKIHKLIIDLRYNGGGNSIFGDYFLTFLNQKPYRLTSGGTLKVSKPVKQYFRTFIPWYYKMFSYLIPNGIIWNHNEKVRIHKKSEPFYTGKFCFLIGINTFSSANLLSNGILDYNLGTLIGESTGEACNDYGDMIFFMLPNSQLIARCPFKQFYRANGDRTDKNPVVPHFYIVADAQEFKEGKDKEMEFALEWLNK